MLMSFPKATRSAGVIVLGTLSLFLLVLSGKAETLALAEEKFQMG